MIDESRTLRFTQFALLLLVFNVSAWGQAPPPAATIQISQPGARATTISFRPDELQQVEREPGYILKKLGGPVGKCCEKAKRISDCIWVCCSGRKVRTCDKVLVKALETLWNKETEHQ
jgi:hypothetical protein